MSQERKGIFLVSDSPANAHAWVASLRQKVTASKTAARAHTFTAVAMEAMAAEALEARQFGPGPTGSSTASGAGLTVRRRCRLTPPSG